MAHIARGSVSTPTYNSTQDKVLVTTSALAAGDLLVAIAMGYGTDDTIDLTGVTDSGGNTWTVVKRSAGSPSRFAMIAWTRLVGSLASGSTVTINMEGSYTRGFAILRAYSGLGGTATATSSRDNYGNPGGTASVATAGPGRVISAVFYPTEFFSADSWVNSFAQTVNYNDVGNVDTFTVGERVSTTAGTMTPSCDIGVSSYYIAVSVSLPEASASSAKRRNQVIAI